MKKLFLHIILILISFNLFAQNPEIKRTWHWYFGEGAGLDFSNDTVVADTNGMIYTPEACAAISDTGGNLLFYTDGVTVWNSNHDTMLNGTGLSGCIYLSSTQGALIVPKPDNDTIYYIFTTDCEENNFFQNGLRYSIVDMSLNGGLGEVTVKNVLLFAPGLEDLASVHHNNGNDVWIVSHEVSNNNFRAYLVTSSGIDTIPVISNIGSISPVELARLRLSPDGKKMTKLIYYDGTPYTLELYSFDNNTGVISNAIPLSSDILLTSQAFSPDNSKLYVIDAFNYAIHQYDLCNKDSAQIVDSKITIAYPMVSCADMRLGPDGKIYVSHDGDNFVGVIHNPNEYGVSCNYQDTGAYVSDIWWKVCNQSLPNFIESYFYTDTISDPCNQTDINENIEQNTISIYPNPAKDNLTIFINSNVYNNGNITIHDILGRKMYKTKIKGNNLYKIDVSEYPSGIYNFNIQYNEKYYNKKFIVIK